MTPRERVLAVMQRQPVDRLPVDIWYTGEIYEKLSAHIGTENEIDLFRALGLDKILWMPAPYRGKLPALEHEGGLVTIFGCQMKPIKSGAATYLEYADRPLAGMEDPEELENYPWWPDPDLFDYDEMAAWVERHCGEWAILGPWVSIFEVYCGLRGLEDAMIDLMDDPEFVTVALDKIEAAQTELMRRLFERTGNKVTFSFISDDMGSQNSLMLSPAIWKEHFAPRLRRWCELSHSFGVYNFYHTDGAVDPIIPGLIEAGVDVLNPIQHRCPGMEAGELKEKYGSRLVFHGGVDTQVELPRGTEEEVRQEVRHCLSTLGRGGEGYICASCHNIQPDTPVENVLAMIDEAKKAGSMASA